MASIRCVTVSKRFSSSSESTMPRMPMVRHREATESRSDDLPSDGAVLALDNINLDVHDGESMVIVGSSGCGKSTLLRCVAGLEAYDGTIYYGNDDMRDVAPRDRGIGIVFQSYALYPQFEAHGNLAFFFKLHKREAEITDRVRQTSEIMGFGFDQLLDRKPATLSGGQKQRVAIARAICRDPKLLLFDEPLSNLDAQLRSTTRIEIRRLINRFNITTLYVTHDQTEATIMGDRLCVMDRGRVTQVGTYRELYDRPLNTFVASFLGAPAMNLLEGVVHAGEVQVNDMTLPLPARALAYVKTGQPIVIGIRPEHITVDPTPEAPGLRVSFDMIERIPSDRVQLLYTTLGGKPSAAEGKRIVVKAPLEQSIPSNVPVSIRIDAAHVFTFDGTTGKRI